MSEYQYYEFLAFDRPLEKSEMEALRAISTRADITSSRFSNVYNYGNLKDAPAKLMEKYFDAQWRNGSRRSQPMRRANISS